jgi:hypothetical protein
MEFDTQKVFIKKAQVDYRPRAWKAKDFGAQIQRFGCSM